MTLGARILVISVYPALGGVNTVSPVRIISSALPRPTMRGVICVPPIGRNQNPPRFPASQNAHFGRQSRTSQASPVPGRPPRASPFIAAITGFSMRPTAAARCIFRVGFPLAAHPLFPRGWRFAGRYKNTTAAGPESPRRYHYPDFI